MKKKEENNKLASLSIKQNLLLWQISKSFLEIEDKIKKSTKIKDE